MSSFVVLSCWSTILPEGPTRSLVPARFTLCLSPAPLAGNAAIPAVDSRRNRLAHLSGRRIVEMVKEDLTINKILTRDAFLNAIRTNAAIGGSTNAVVHLLAIAKRLGVELTLDVSSSSCYGVPDSSEHAIVQCGLLSSC